jgi:16S rRNA (cytidine1402-2'-O)-methyltransferase
MSNQNISEYTFYVVATPIGNLEDMTFRAVRTLQEVDTILCEDTRTTKHLTDHYGITTSRESYHANSNQAKEESILQRVIKGETFALVSDAGTPSISDPGVKIIARLKQELGSDIAIVPIPGASAVITAVSATGFSGNDFRFFGFVPHKKGRESFFQEVSEHESIAAFYESPHRIMKTLEYLTSHEELQNRTTAIARELTKTFEEIVTGTPQYLLEYYTENESKVRGEFVVVLDRKEK